MSRLLGSLRSPPIVAAPMAGGYNTPAFVSEVIRCGGIGSFGWAYSSPDRIAQDLAAMPEEFLSRINANFFIFPEQEEFAKVKQNEIDAAILNLGKHNLPTPDIDTLFVDLNNSQNLEAQLEPVFRCRPGMVTFHFGVPRPSIITRAKACGILVGITATSVHEAQLVEASGSDFIVAQGIEAGGHRGIMDVDAYDSELSTEALVAALRSAGVQLPIVAAGGIMKGSHIANVLRSGADAVQLGTAFLVTQECGASATHKRYLTQERERGSVVTRAFSGRRARGVRNTFTEIMRAEPTLPFPIQYRLTSALRQQSSERGDGEFQALWCGANYSDCRTPLTVDELMTALRSEFDDTMTSRPPLPATSMQREEKQ